MRLAPACSWHYPLSCGGQLSCVVSVQAKAFVADPSAFAAVVQQTTSAAAETKEEPEAAKKEESEEESDDDMGFGLFD